MSLIKNNMKLFIFIFIVALIGGGIYYYTSILSPQIQTLESLREQNIAKEQKLQLLEKELHMLPEKKHQLEDLGLQINALKNKIPSYQISVMMMMEIVQYMDIYNFEDTEVNIGESLKQEDETDTYYIMPVTIKYTTTYTNTVQFIEAINRSYQMISVDSLSINNSIQEQSNKDAKKIVSEDTIEAEVVLSLYYKDKEEVVVEHPNFIEFFNKEEKVFSRSGLEETTDIASLLLTDARENETVTSRESLIFNLYVSDVFSSGDNYSFSGYGPNQDPVYVGLASSKDTKISLTIRDNGYSCVIEDSEGKKSEKSIDIPVRNPSITITSQIQKVMEEMPRVSIYVRNYTANAVKINMRGSHLDNISVYNENGEKVPIGK